MAPDPHLVHVLERGEKPPRKRGDLPGPEPNRVAPGEELLAQLARYRRDHLGIRAQEVERGERVFCGAPAALQAGDVLPELLVFRRAFGPQRRGRHRNALRAERLDELASMLTCAHHALEVAGDVHLLGAAG